MTLDLDSILKKIDPVVSSALDRALSDKDVSVAHAIDLLDSNGIEMNMLINMLTNYSIQLIRVITENTEYENHLIYYYLTHSQI